MNEYRHVHRATPLLKFWTVLLAVLAAFAANISGSAARDIYSALREGQLQSLWVVGAVAAFVAVCVGIWIVSGIWWKAMGFQLGDEEVALKHGVISKSLRTARYDRIQAVDVVEPVIARIFGVAKVRIETAGGGDSVLEILYLKKLEAEQVRAEVLAKSHGSQATETSLEMPRPAESAAEVEEREAETKGTGPRGATIIPPIPVQRSLMAAALNPMSIILIGCIAVVVFVPGGWGIVFPLLVGFLPAVWNVIDTSWEFSAVRDGREGNVLNVAFGLADKRRQSIPLHRIHAVEVTQPVLWRGLGWWRVRVSIAGYGTNEKTGGTTTLLPVGSFDQALAMLELLSPLSAGDIADGANPRGRTISQFTSPEQARWVSPIDWRQQGTTLIDDRAIIIHSKRLGKRMAVVSPKHVQELSYHRGLLEHVLGLASVRLDLVPGPVSMSSTQLTVDDAQQLLQRLRQRELPTISSIQ